MCLRCACAVQLCCSAIPSDMTQMQGDLNDNATIWKRSGGSGIQHRWLYIIIGVIGVNHFTMLSYVLSVLRSFLRQRQHSLRYTQSHSQKWKRCRSDIGLTVAAAPPSVEYKYTLSVSGFSHIHVTTFFFGFIHIFLERIKNEGEKELLNEPHCSRRFACFSWNCFTVLCCALPVRIPEIIG